MRTSRYSFAFLALTTSLLGSGVTMGCGDSSQDSNGGGGTSQTSQSATTGGQTTGAQTTGAQTTSSQGTGGEGGQPGCAANSVCGLLADIPYDTAWADVPETTKTALRDLALARRYAYRAEWGQAGLAAKEEQFLSAPTAEMTDNFNQFVRDLFQSELGGEPFTATTDLANSPLLEPLKRFYVTTLGTWRVLGPNYHALLLDDGVTHIADWDGISKIDEMPLPDPQTIADQKDHALALHTMFKGLTLSSDLENQIRAKSVVLLRQLKSGSTNWSLGGDDLLTVNGLGDWSWDLMFAYSPDGGQIYPAEAGDAEFLEQTNAFYYYDDTDPQTLKYLNKGRVASFDWIFEGTAPSAEGLTPEEFQDALAQSDLAYYIGLPTESPTAKAYFLLSSWFRERVHAHPNATATCTIYDAPAQEAAWESFTADNFYDPTIPGASTSFADYQAKLGPYGDAKTASFRQSVLDALDSFDAETANMYATQIAAAKASIPVGTAHGVIVDHVIAAMGGTGVVPASLFEAKITSSLDGGELEVLGGHDPAEPNYDTLVAEDTEKLNAMWSEFRAFVAIEYPQTLNVNGVPTTIAELLPATLTIDPNEIGAFAMPDGSITVGLAAPYSKLNMYGTLIHEGHHAINFNSGRLVEGPSWEGAAVVTQTLVLRKFLHWLPSEALPIDDPAALPEAAVPYQWLDIGRFDGYYLATSNSTARIFTRPGTVGMVCDPDTEAYVHDYAIQTWGTTEERAARSVVRAHEGTAYLQYSFGEILSGSAVSNVQAIVNPGGSEIDPYQFVACGVVNPTAMAPNDAATIMSACLAP